jgi:hypothetical protein
VLDADHGKVAHIRATIATIKPLIATVMTDITRVADRSATLLVVYLLKLD